MNDILIMIVFFLDLMKHIDFVKTNNVNLYS